MKRILIILTTLLTLILLTGCGGSKTYKEIEFDELTQLIEEKQDFILFIGAETCSACKDYKVTLNKIVENHQIDIKYIDNDKLSEEEYSTLMSNFYISSTPITVFVTKGKEKDRVVGNQKYSKLEKILKKQGYIKE